MTNHSKHKCPPESVEGHPSGEVPERRRGFNDTSHLDQTFPSSKFLFSEVTAYLQKFGRQTYGNHFTIIEEDYETIYKLLVYFYQDVKQAEKLNIKLHKGILLTGPIGCGKTTLMSLLRYIYSPEKQYIMLPTRKIAYEFAEEGFKIINKYSTQSFKSSGSELLPKTYCFDDLGVESSIQHFGNKLNIMAEILLNRYDLFIAHQMQTHFTTNLSASEIEDIYGNRVRSRLREMINVLAFHAHIEDKRR